MVEHKTIWCWIPYLGLRYFSTIWIETGPNKFLPSNVVIGYTEKNIFWFNICVYNFTFFVKILKSFKCLSNDRANAFTRKTAVIRLNESFVFLFFMGFFTLIIHFRRWWPSTSKTMTTWVPFTPWILKSSSNWTHFSRNGSTGSDSRTHVNSFISSTAVSV